MTAQKSSSKRKPSGVARGSATATRSRTAPMQTVAPRRPAVDGPTVQLPPKAPPVVPGPKAEEIAPVSTPPVGQAPLRLVDQVQLGVPPHLIRERRVDRALNLLQKLAGPRPPMLLPPSDNARAAATAAICSIRTRMEVIGETEFHRPVMEVANEVLDAAAPFIQRDLINRLMADRLMMLATILGGGSAAAAGLLCAVGYGLYAGVTWLVVVAGMCLAVSGFATVNLAMAISRQTRRAESVVEQPFTDERIDEAAETIDLATAKPKDGK